MKPLLCKDILLDSGAFTELNLYGEYRTSCEEYAEELHRLHTLGVVNITAAVTQDYMCEAFMLKKTNLSVSEHQTLTIERYDALVLCLNLLFDGAIPFHILPVLQGYTAAEYVSHIKQYGDRLKKGMWCGVGSVCKRNSSPRDIVHIIRMIKRERPDLKLHGFGIKLTAFQSKFVVDNLTTADSMAWSFGARYYGKQNDYREAIAFTSKIKQMCGMWRR